MNKKKLAWMVPLLLSAVLVVGTYLGLAGYYANRFCYGTWINGVYCTGLTVEQVNKELLQRSTYDTLTVIDRNRSEHDVLLAEIDYEMDYTKALENVKKQQPSFLWIRYFFEDQRYDIMPDVVFSDDKLKEIMENADFMQKEVLGTNNKAEIVMTENGYQLVDHTINQLDKERTMQAISDALKELKHEIYIDAVDGCYVSLPETRETAETYELWKDVYSFQDFKLTYLMGDKTEVIDASVVSKWIAVDPVTGNFLKDENGKLFLDETKVMEYVTWLGAQYDTYGKPRQFTTTAGHEVTIEKSIYGNDINEEEECALLIEDFIQNRDGLRREPVYAQKAACQGTNDVGGTYIEVDMTAQMLYFYQDYEIALETPVVTGNMRRGWDTPSVACSIYGMARNRILRGATYATFVYYWMPVYGNIGLHDATWRRTFGDDVYMTDGSHGCINMPKDMAAELYDMVEIGTPVFLFY